VTRLDSCWARLAEKKSPCREGAWRGDLGWGGSGLYIKWGWRGALLWLDNRGCGCLVACGRFYFRLCGGGGCGACDVACGGRCRSVGGGEGKALGIFRTLSTREPNWTIGAWKDEWL